MLIVRATGKLRQRLGRPTLREVEAAATTLLGEWYATALFWRPQVALLVNEPTLLPVLMPSHRRPRRWRNRWRNG